MCRMSNITCSQSHLKKIEMILKGSQCGGETNARRENSHLTGQFVLRNVPVVSSQAAIAAAWLATIHPRCYGYLLNAANIFHVLIF